MSKLNSLHFEAPPNSWIEQCFESDYLQKGTIYFAHETFHAMASPCDCDPALQPGASSCAAETTQERRLNFMQM